MLVCKYLNQRVRRIGEQNGKSFKGVSKTKKKKQHIKRLSFITQFKIEFLLPFTSCRKVLGKMPDIYVCIQYSEHTPVFSKMMLHTGEKGPKTTQLLAKVH